MTTSGLSAAAVGLGATVFMDIWALLVNRAFGIVPANYCLVGRWFCHMPRGVFAHASIANASKRPFECAVGWIAHYVIGAFYGVVFVAIVSADWLIRPTFVAAVLFGIVSVIVPFLIMQGALDNNVLPETQEKFAKTYKAAGGQVEYVLFENAVHEWVAEPGLQTDKARDVAKAFIARQLRMS